VYLRTAIAVDLILGIGKQRRKRVPIEARWCKRFLLITLNCSEVIFRNADSWPRKCGP